MGVVFDESLLVAMVVTVHMAVSLSLVDPVGIVFDPLTCSSDLMMVAGMVLYFAELADSVVVAVVQLVSKDL